MNSFANMIQEWQVFFSAVAGVAATLSGLLFVSISLSLDIFADENQAFVKHLTRQNLQKFFTVLVIAIVFLTPLSHPLAISITLVWAGIAGVIGSLSLRKEWYKDPKYQKIFSLWSWYGITLLSYLTFALAGIGLYFGYSDSLSYLVGAILTLMMSASKDAWVLLVEVRAKNSTQ